MAERLRAFLVRLGLWPQPQPPRYWTCIVTGCVAPSEPRMEIGKGTAPGAPFCHNHGWGDV